MNKKAVIPVIVWIVLGIVGLYVAYEVGLFATFTPPHLIPEAGAESLVNPWYYDNALSNQNYACQQDVKVIWRSTFSPTLNELPSSSDFIAFTLSPGSSSLEKHYRLSGGGYTSQSGSCIEKHGQPIFTATGLDFKVYSDMICFDRTDGKHNYRKYGSDLGRNPLSFSTDPGQGGNELSISTDIKNEGEFNAYCDLANNRIINQYCGDFGFDLVETCFLGCEYVRNQEVGELRRDIVKCAGKYMPNAEFCLGDRLYSVSSDGDSYAPPEDCQVDCLQTTQMNRLTGRAPQADCITCGNGWQRCGLNDDVEECFNNQWSLKQDCINTQTCSPIAGQDHKAECTSENQPGDERCLVKQPQRMNSLYVWENNGDVCDLSCDDSTGDAVCELECSNLDGIRCNSVLAKLEICQNTDRDNDWNAYPEGTNGECISGSCASSGDSCHPVKPLGRYCSEGDIWESKLDPSKILDGGVRQDQVQTCVIGCEGTGSNTRCIPLTRCDGNFGDTICSLDGQKVELCSNTGETSSVVDNCPVDHATGWYCSTETGSAVCTEPIPDCDGDTECVGSSVYSCSNGNLGAEDYSCIPGSDFGLEGGGCEESNFEAVCSDICDSSKPNLCISEDQYSCTLDSTTGQFIPTDLKDCSNLGCDEDTGRCAIQCSGEETCDGGVLKECNNGVIGIETDDCNDAGCDTTTDLCTNECVSEGDLGCKNNDRYVCRRQSNDQFILEFDIDCPDNLGCDVLTGDCVHQCETDPFCSGGVNIRACLTGGIIGGITDECYGLGCEEINGFPYCIDECENTERPSCKDGENGDSYNCVPQDNEQKIYELAETCGSPGCDEDTGLCIAECAGDSYCSSAGDLRACVDNRRQQQVVDDCYEKGCDVATDKCIDECELPTTFSCIDGDSYICNSQSNEQKLLELYLECGFEGCATSTGKCTAREPNTYVCIGQALHSTDGEGFLSPNPIKICSAEGLRNGLQPYCSEGFEDCKACEQGEYICDSQGLSQCANVFTGERSNLQSCEAGCSQEGGNYYCDQFSAVINSNQNFFTESNIIVEGLLTGTQTEKGIQTPYTAKIEGTGVDQTVSGSSDANGNLAIGFGIKPIGEYVITITLIEFDGTFIVNSKVTNDYIINLSGAQVVTKIPGVTTKVVIEASDKDGGVPDDVIVSDAPSGVNIVSNPSGISGRWDVEVDGEFGQYSIGLTPIKNDIELDEQFIDIEIRKPILEVTSNVPDSSKPGKETYDINVVGPTAEGVSKGVNPDSITATISHSPSETLTLLDLGGGIYTFEYDFVELGTYTINVVAEKEGYESSSFSEQIQISSSGTEAPPGAGSGGTGAGDGGTGDDTGTGDDEPTDEPTPFDNKTIIIIIIIAAIYFFFLRGKGR